MSRSDQALVARGTRSVSMLLAMMLFVAACGADDTAEAPAAAATDGSVQASERVVPALAEPDGTTTTTTLRPPTPTDPPEREAPSIGDLEIPCRAAGLEPLPERAGVTADAIIIGTGTDRGGVVTASGRGALDMVEALVDHCNALGGLLGRDLRVVEFDAAGVEAADRVANACDEVVALVGSTFLQRFEAAVAAAACGLPSFPAGAGLIPTDPIGLHGHVVALFADPASAASIVLVGPDTASAAFARADRSAAIALSGGALTVVGDVAYPLDRTPDWDRIAAEARRTGAGQVHLSGGCAAVVVPFSAAAARAGWAPIVLTTAQSYDEVCLGVDNPQRLLVEVPFLPFEDGPAAPSAMAHGELLDAIAAPRTGEGILAASAFWRWASAAVTCLAGAEGACVDAAADGADDWTGAGVHPALAADGTSEGCAVVLGVEDGAFVRRLPVEPGEYDCSPELSVALG